MKRISLENLGKKVLKKRGAHGIRATAKEIKVSPATLSRIENGHMPDLETFRRVCEWLEVNPGDVLGSQVSSAGAGSRGIPVHFKKDKAVSKETAKSLANMIVAATAMLDKKQEES